jgi:hypothetical protein
MELRDRTANYLFVLLAIASWAGVAAVLTTTYPHANPSNALVGAGIIGLACGLTAVPFFWLAVFALHHRIAFRGDWSRALRRGAWVTLLVAILVALRVQGVLSLPIAAFAVALVILAEVTLSAER